MISGEEAKRLLAASKTIVDGSRPGQIHLRYCETLTVQPGWECLELFARAPEMAETIIALEKELKTRG